MAVFTLSKTKYEHALYYTIYGANSSYVVMILTYFYSVFSRNQDVKSPHGFELSEEGNCFSAQPPPPPPLHQGVRWSYNIDFLVL